jgi:hypothetical protein
MLICEFSHFLRSIELNNGGYSVRFAPPLVIEEEDLLRAIRIIGECLEDLDNVGIFCSYCLSSLTCLFVAAGRYPR